ncbi:hypothetical protein [Microvirga yunnanensis]|uniref:hypothetical protein n=1 Tax=Microvirga yunnanensis TaxID=2953740 RepID=UPI0021C97D2A|nr:hypothetical protein [Microvirga sp. HBU67655]
MRLKLPIAQFLKAQRRWGKTLVKASTASRKLIVKPRKTQPKKSKLTEISAFGSNPGNLRMLTYVPPQLPDSAPLVVVLHGCLQTARAYDEGSGSRCGSSRSSSRSSLRRSPTTRSLVRFWMDAPSENSSVRPKASLTTRSRNWPFRQTPLVR